MENIVSDAAEWLLTARQDMRVQSNLPTSLYPDSVLQAYLVQEELVSRMSKLNDSPVIGYKLACTFAPLMKMLGTDGPFYGCLMVHSTYQNNIKLEAENFSQRIVEPEFLLEMSADLPASDEPYTAQSILPYIGDLFPSIEVVDHRYTDFTKVGVNALIADNAIHGVSVLGEAVSDWKSFDLVTHKVDLCINGKIKETGIGENVLGNPLNAMAWLANTLKSRGKTLKKGDLVTTGATSPTYQAVAGDLVRGDFGQLGEVILSFT
ncbi:MAG: hypothetical protein OXE41_09060 [Gammaproteobacteria bacterium]|nr:hypothetical protein [Gammaproteobacteria bacterium]MCY4219170.1 hypothetical protein [Gammaproteobacteria bacterium]MCY4275525.1 hypothetical protein [Gammaproteobacteria bacterium]